MKHCIWRNVIALQFCILILLNVIGSSHETIYSCNSNVSCGCSMNSAIVSRIVGGEPAGSATWGWAVSIRIGSGRLCGGSIISSSWIITAAHCVAGFLASQLTVYAGSNTRWSGSQIRTVSVVIVHSRYSGGTNINDIALLKLNSPLIITDPYVNSICLPSVSQATLAAGEWPPVGTNVVAIGWGTLTEDGSLPTALQQVTVKTVDYRASTCARLIADRQVQLCAGVSGGGKDTCQGDSGGPLMMFSSNNQWILIGLTSSGIGCALAEYSGLYTRVAAFQDWILSNIKNSNATLSFLSSSITEDYSTTAVENISAPVIHTHKRIFVIFVLAFLFLL